MWKTRFRSWSRAFCAALVFAMIAYRFIFSMNGRILMKLQMEALFVWIASGGDTNGMLHFNTESQLIRGGRIMRFV